MVAAMDISPVEVVEGVEPQSIPEEVFNSDKPLLLKGLVADWPAVKACSQGLDSAARYLSNFWVDNPVTVCGVAARRRPPFPGAAAAGRPGSRGR